MYRLSESMSDRMKFDRAVHYYAYDCARHAERDLTDAMLKVYRENFIDEDEVDDVAEAEARFDSAFRLAWNER